MIQIIQTERHQGYCGHCRTEVHVKANTCPSCLSYWGLSNGLTRNDIFLLAQRKIKMIRWYSYLMFISLVLFLLGVNFFIGVLYFGSLLMPVVFVFLLLARKEKRLALDTSKGVVDWWIKR